MSSNNILYDRVSVSPVFSIFVDDDVIDESGEITDYKNGIIKDYVGIVFDPVCAFDNESSVAVVGEFDYENTPVFFVRFSEFVIKLNESGYELDGVHSFGDICEKISFDESAVGEISVQFEKENVPQK